jgi:hypothetical protein
LADQDVPARAEDPSRAWLRIVDRHSGVHDVVGPVDAIARMTATVSRCLEGGREGSRFPLLRLVSRRPALSAEECDALGREIARLRGLLSVVSISSLEDRPSPTSDPALAAAAPLDAPREPEPFPRWNGSAAPRTLADAFAWPLHVLENVARLGAASRRGASLEVGMGPARDGARVATDLAAPRFVRDASPAPRD